MEGGASSFVLGGGGGALEALSLDGGGGIDCWGTGEESIRQGVSL